jgi:broad specificity phosphatase PhoE
MTLSCWRRLPFVAAAVTLSAVLLVPALAQGQKLVIAVRHAERADGGAMATSPQTDPPLSAAGEARARKLADALRDAGVTAVFATEYKRTQDTVKPLATAAGLTPQVVKAADTAALVAKLKSAHASDVVLVVGHSNTLPAIIKALGGPDIRIADDQYDDIFIVVPSTGAMTRIKY